MTFLFPVYIFSAEKVLLELNDKKCEFHGFIDEADMESDGIVTLNSGSNSNGSTWVEVGESIFYLITHGVTITPDFQRIQKGSTTIFKKAVKKEQGYLCNSQRKSTDRNIIRKFTIFERGVEFYIYYECGKYFPEKNSSKGVCTFVHSK